MPVMQIIETKIEKEGETVLHKVELTDDFPPSVVAGYLVRAVGGAALTESEWATLNHMHLFGHMGETMRGVYVSARVIESY